jgi:hypothetical protein
VIQRFGGARFVLHIKGKSRDEAFDDRPLEVRQSHSSEEACEQIGLITKAECGAKGTDREETFSAED